MSKSREAAERFAERRRREDESQRLLELQPDLLTCRIDVTEGGGSVTGSEVAHTRTVIVERAPALFVIPCHDSACRDGGYDITNEMLRGLRSKQSEIEGENRCMGSIGNGGSCTRILKFKAISTYRAS